MLKNCLASFSLCIPNPELLTELFKNSTYSKMSYHPVATDLVYLFEDEICCRPCIPKEILKLAEIYHNGRAICIV